MGVRGVLAASLSLGRPAGQAGLLTPTEEVISLVFLSGGALSALCQELGLESAGWWGTHPALLHQGHSLSRATPVVVEGLLEMGGTE